MNTLSAEKTNRKGRTAKSALPTSQQIRWFDIFDVLDGLREQVDAARPMLDTSARDIIAEAMTRIEEELIRVRPRSR